MLGCLNFQHQHPYVSAMVNNGTLHYDHDRDGTHTELAGCSSLFRNKEHATFMAIRYEGHTLKVSIIWKLRNFYFCGIVYQLVYYVFSLESHHQNLREMP